MVQPPLLSLALTPVALLPCAAAPATLDIGSSTQLLVDELIIASQANLTRTMHSPQPAFHTAIRPDAPWESGYAIGLVGTTAVADGDATEIDP